ARWRGLPSRWHLYFGQGDAPTSWSGRSAFARWSRPRAGTSVASTALKSTVYEDQLQKHLKKCNSREKPKPVYFAKDINAGLKNETELSEEQQAPISALSKQELDNLIRKLKKASNTINYELKDQILSHQALQEALNDPQNGDAAFKHLKQQASILGNMKRLHLLGPGNCFVEFGAGRGKLSHWLDIALQDVQDVHFLLVERASTRFKVDGKHNKRYFERLQVDIQHLCLSKLLKGLSMNSLKNNANDHGCCSFKKNNAGSIHCSYDRNAVATELVLNAKIILAQIQGLLDNVKNKSIM
uniref:tRNA:m(4)X modification enzyme TRM13 n=1 Tax=Pseudonaja textilis TaxID=8673 RepID=A0A670YDG2_PSETE